MCGGGGQGQLTLETADVRPLRPLHHGPLQLGAEGHVVDVVQQDAHHLAGEMLQPGEGDHLAELQRWRGERDLTFRPPSGVRFVLSELARPG